jgi:hypothetical protein
MKAFKSRLSFIQGILTEGKDQYNEPPSTNYFRSAAFCNDLFSFNKTNYLKKEFNRTVPYPLVRVPCSSYPPMANEAF